MKISHNRYEALLKRVSNPILRSYEKTIGTELFTANAKFVASTKKISRMARLMIFSVLGVFILPVPLAIFFCKSGLIVSKAEAVDLAMVLVALVIVGLEICLYKLLSRATKTRDDAEKVLQEFENMVHTLEPERFFFSGSAGVFNEETAHQYLIAKAREVLDAEALEAHVKASKRFSSVPDICSIFENVLSKKQQLDKALDCQEYLGFAYSRAELFREAEALINEQC